MITLALSVVLLCGAPEYKDLVGPVVKYENPTGNGTAFAIDKDKLMTVAHLVPKKDGAESWICYGVSPCKHRKVKVLKIDRKLDLAVLEVKDHGLPPVKWRTGAPPADLETVWIVGRPAGFSKIPLRGYVAGADPRLPGKVRLVVGTFPGTSGGPVYDEQGRVWGVMAQAIMQNRQIIQFLSYVVPVRVLSAWKKL